MREHWKLDRATVAAHGLRALSPEQWPEGFLSTPAAEPIYQTAVFDFPSIEASEGPLAGEGGFVYARHGLPNARTLELTVAALEGAEDALATSSGMAAVACTLFALARAGDRVVFQRDAYGGTVALLSQDFARFGVEVEAVDAYDLAAVEAALSRPTRVLLVETLSNPLVRPVDVRALGERCRARGVRLVVDNTFATPIFARPLQEGADLVVHSATKFLGGHHDLCAGIVAGSQTIIGEARGVARRLGTHAAAFDAWLATRGIRTLEVRLLRAQENARALAERLRHDPRVEKVHYPGWGALLSFDVGDASAAARAVRSFRLVKLTPSLGGTATTVSHPASSSHRGLSPAERRAIGISDGLLRLSVGIDAAQDVWDDLDLGLAAASAKSRAVRESAPG